MIVNGGTLAQTIDERTQDALADHAIPLRLAIITCAPTAATQKFLALKRARATQLGVELSLHTCAPECTTEEIVAAVHSACAEHDGVVVQLPFPEHIDVVSVLAAVPAAYDVDAIGHEAETLLAQNESMVLPPVVGAIRAIAEAHDFSFADARVVVVGEGRLVGKPAAVWCKHQGADVTVVTKETDDLAAHTATADVLVLGAGVPGLITPDMIKDGVAIFDAGTSEDAGKLVGDADPRCAAHASLFTPVPGGIGPITVSMIFHNLVQLAARGRVDTELV